MNHVINTVKLKFDLNNACLWKAYLQNRVQENAEFFKFFKDSNCKDWLENMYTQLSPLAAA